MQQNFSYEINERKNAHDLFTDATTHGRLI